MSLAQRLLSGIGSFALSGDLVYTIRTTANNQRYRLFGRAGNVYNATIDWGDGNTSTINAYNSASLDNFYAVPGIYQIKITGTFPFIAFGDSLNPNPRNIISLDKMSAGSLHSLYFLFFQEYNLTSVSSQFDLSTQPSLYGTWYWCTGLTSFPLLNTSSVTNMAWAWQSCTSLTSFPVLNTSSVTNMVSAWGGCTSLTSFPILNTSSVTNMTGAWDGCTSLTSFPVLNTSSVTNMAWAWYRCTGLTSFPVLNTSSVINMSATWYNCTSLTSFPVLNTSSATDISHSWQSCTGLTSFPLLNTINVTNMSFSWQSCTGLTSFPLLNTINVTNMSFSWRWCTSLTSFPLLNTINVTDMAWAWYGCTSLVNFPANMFDSSLCTNYNSSFINCALSTASVTNILVSIDTAGQLNGTLDITGGTSATPSGAGLAAKNSLIAKGWTVITN